MFRGVSKACWLGGFGGFVNALGQAGLSAVGCILVNDAALPGFVDDAECLRNALEDFRGYRGGL